MSGFARIAAGVLVLVLSASLRAEAPPAEAPPWPAESHARGGLPNVAAKLAGGQAVRVAYLGGSITAAPGWRVLSLEWLKKQYPSAALMEINAAIGGTGAEFGACRLGAEVLAQKPDLLFVEFAVNDGGTPPDRLTRAIEGIVRQAWRADPTTDVCFVYTLGEGDLKKLREGSYQPSAVTMERVAERYGIPSIHFGVEVAKLEHAGRLVFIAPLPKTDAEKEALGGKIPFAGDHVHPHVATGHPLYVDAIRRAWPALCLGPREVAHDLGEPLDAESWERAGMTPMGDVAREGAWTAMGKDTPQAKSAGRHGAALWGACETGAALSFRFKGRMFGLYGLKGPDAGNFRVMVDDQEPVVAAQFDAYCTANRWRIDPWFYPRPLEDAEHRVRIELLGTAPDKDQILKARNEKLDDSVQKAATCLHASHVLCVGGPVL